MSILDEEAQRAVQPRFLDLSGVHVSTKEELQNIMFKMLEVRLRPDKLTEEEISRIIYCESSSPTAEYPFLDPIPASMRDVNLTELSQVDIDWKMLTLARPNTKQEMEIFTRFVELEKLKLKSLCQEDEKAEEIRVTAIKVKFQADGFEQETNSDEFTYEYFSRTLAAEELPSSTAEDSSKKAPEEDKRKLSQKVDSVTRQETFPDPVEESPSPIPDAELEIKRQLSAKKKKNKSKNLRKKRIKRKRKRRIKRLKNGRVVFLTLKRRKKWSILKKKKRKKGKLKEDCVLKEESETKGNVIKSAEQEAATDDAEKVNSDVLNEIKDSNDITSAEIKESGSSKKPGKNKKSLTGKKIKKLRKNNLSNASKADADVTKKSGTPGGKNINKPRHVKGVSSRALIKRGTFARSTSVRHAKTAKAGTRMKISQKSRAKRETVTAKLDADGGKGTDPEDETAANDERDTETKISSAKLSSSSAGGKMKVKNRRSPKTLVNSNVDSKRTTKSSSGKPPNEEDPKESNNGKGDLT